MTEIRAIASPETNIGLLHNEMGFRFQHYRSWGFNGRVAGENSRWEFKGDHDWLKEASRPEYDDVSDWPRASRSADQGERAARAPQRANFGLPHNYLNRSPVNTEGYLDPAVDRRNLEIHPSGDYDRRASPLFLHLHGPLADGNCAVWFFLDAEFLPTESEGRVTLSVTRKKTFKDEGSRSRGSGSNTIKSELTVDRSVIVGFLDDLDKFGGKNIIH